MGLERSVLKTKKTTLVMLLHRQKQNIQLISDLIPPKNHNYFHYSEEKKTSNIIYTKTSHTKPNKNHKQKTYHSKY